jgi:hypothetical protein
MLILAASGASTWVGWAVAVLVLFVGVPLSILRYRKRGPALGWVPRRWRGKTNSWYTARGWDAPYDASGKKRQRW